VVADNGEVVEMRSLRAVLLAIIAAIALLGGVASTAFADEGGASSDPTVVDPGDPGLPPD